MLLFSITLLTTRRVIALFHHGWEAIPHIVYDMPLAQHSTLGMGTKAMRTGRMA
jgi:hypothetical protein